MVYTMIVTCNNCKKNFQNNLVTKTLDEEMQITYTCIVCPVCGMEYVICVDNCLTRNLKRSISKLRTHVPDGIPELEKKERRIKHMVSRLQREEKKLLKIWR